MACLGPNRQGVCHMSLYVGYVVGPRSTDNASSDVLSCHTFLQIVVSDSLIRRKQSRLRLTLTAHSCDSGRGPLYSLEPVQHTEHVIPATFLYIVPGEHDYPALWQTSTNSSTVRKSTDPYARILFFISKHNDECWRSVQSWIYSIEIIHLFEVRLDDTRSVGAARYLP